MGLERLDSHMQKDETGPLSYMIHKNQLQMDWWHECRTWNHKTNRKKITGNKLLDIDFDNGVFEFDNKSKGEKKKDLVQLMTLVERSQSHLPSFEGGRRVL